MRQASRVMVYLCALLFLNEFGPAHFHRILSRDLRAIKSSHLGNDNQRNHGNKMVRERRGAAATLGKFLFKALEFTSKYFKDVTSLVSLATTIYVLATKNCCSKLDTEVCDLQEEAKKISEYIDEESKNINKIQLHTENLQTVIESLNSLYNTTVENMKEVGYLSEKFLEGVEPDIQETLNQTTLEIQKMVLEQQKVKKTVDYVVVGKTYFTRLEQVISIAVPVFVTVLPKVPKIAKFGTDRLGRLKSWEISEKFSNIKMPGSNTAAYKGMKSWFAKTSDYVTTQAGKLRTLITTKYSKAVTVVKGLQKGFSVLSGFLMGAFNIYTSIQNVKKCDKMKKDVLSAVKELRKANQTFTEIYQNVTTAKKNMEKARDNMYSKVTDEVFLSDLQETRDNMLTIQGDGKGLQDMIDQITQYLDSIKSTTDINEVVPLYTQVYLALGSLPFVYRCLNDKTWFISFIAKGCEEGDNPLSELISRARVQYNYEIQDCEKRTGIPYITDEVIADMIDKASKEKGFNKNCILNSKTTKDLICSLKCQPMTLKEVAKRFEDRGIPEATLKTIYDDCPPYKNNPYKDRVCLLRDIKPGITDKEIQEKFPNLTLEEIAKIDCSEYES